MGLVRGRAAVGKGRGTASAKSNTRDSSRLSSSDRFESETQQRSVGSAPTGSPASPSPPPTNYSIPADDTVTPVGRGPQRRTGCTKGGEAKGAQAASQNTATANYLKVLAEAAQEQVGLLIAKLSHAKILYPKKHILDIHCRNLMNKSAFKCDELILYHIFLLGWILKTLFVIL